MSNDTFELTAREIFEEALPEIARKHEEVSKAINSILVIELSGENGGSWSLDLTGTPVASRGIVEGAQCVIKMEADRFLTLLRTRKIRPWLTAYKSRKINITGDLPTVVKLGQLLNKAVRKES